MDWEKASEELSKKLDPDHVKKPDGRFGPKGDYIEGWHAIAEANRIFGFGAWSYEIRKLSQDALNQGKDSKGNMQWQAAYTCLVSVRVGDVTREDVGFGSGFSKQIGDAIEGATKEAVTDALKRALRTFGNPFGLALYDKKKENVGRDKPDDSKEPSPEPGPEAILSEEQRLTDKLSACTTTQHLAGAWKGEKWALEKLRDQSPQAFTRVSKAKDALKARLMNDPANQAPPPDHVSGGFDEARA